MHVKTAFLFLLSVKHIHGTSFQSLQWDMSSDNRTYLLWTLRWERPAACKRQSPCHRRQSDGTIFSFSHASLRRQPTAAVHTVSQGQTYWTKVILVFKLMPVSVKSYRVKSFADKSNYSTRPHPGLQPYRRVSGRCRAADWTDDLM